MTDEKTNELTDALSTIIEKDIPLDKGFSWSSHQEAIFEFVKNGEGNAVVDAVAGSGKTTTILEALKYTSISADIAFVAFGKRIADELRERAPDHVHVSTLHSLGLKNIRNSLGYVKVENNKMWMLWDEVLEDAMTAAYEAGEKFKKERLTDNVVVILRLVSLLKAVLGQPTVENMQWIADRYSLPINGEADIIFASARSLWKKSLDTIKEMIDFDDMIFAPAWGVVDCTKFDFLFVDEAQDLNNAQIQFVLRSIADGGRVVAVGDPFQAIYGFRGADADAIPNLIDALNATILPLSITYRCPIKVVELAQQFVPHLEAREGAPEGVIQHINANQLMSYVEEDDLVICRVNAPLVKPAFELIRRGIKAVILGREIGKGLSNLIDKIGKRANAQDLGDLLRALAVHRDQQVAKLLASKKFTRAANLDDQVETILALADNAHTIQTLKSNIYKVFADDRKGVTFSSIHKVKGGEANRVFILHPEKMPHPMATADWELVQENNIIYVAYTRAIEELFFVHGE